MIKSFATELDYAVPDDLNSFIVKVIQGESKKPVHLTYPVFAIGYPLIIYVYDDLPLLHVGSKTIRPESRLNVAGQVSNERINIEINGRFGQIGFLLYPSAPYYLFHKPGKYFLNKWRSFDEASPLGAGQLMRTLALCKDPVDRIKPLMNFLKELAQKRLPSIDWMDTSLKEIYKHDGNIAQRELVEKIGIGERHFRRKFKEVIGVPPKYFCKVVQMNTVFELLKSANSTKLHQLALECGYYDQAHFINDFNRLIGNSPKSFLQGRHSFVRTYLGRGS